LSSSITCTPFSKFAVPFWPTEAKWPLTAIDSGGAVIALLTFDGLLPFVLEDTGDKGGERFDVAMMTSLRILAYFMFPGSNILALQIDHLTSKDWGNLSSVNLWRLLRHEPLT
jgi:hypothetical protein